MQLPQIVLPPPATDAGKKACCCRHKFPERKAGQEKRGFLFLFFSFGLICWAEERVSGAEAEGRPLFLPTHLPHFHSPRARSNCCPFRCSGKSRRGAVLPLMDGRMGCCSDRRSPFSLLPRLKSRKNVSFVTPADKTVGYSYSCFHSTEKAYLLYQVDPLIKYFFIMCSSC